jgi:hypothetical protein
LLVELFIEIIESKTYWIILIKNRGGKLVIWNEALPETVEKINFFQQKKQRAIKVVLGSKTA